MSVSFGKGVVERLSTAATWVSAFSILAMMGVTCIDVLLRTLRMPIAGAYEAVGYLGALMVSFSLADTTLKGGHIRVEFLMEKLSPKIQAAAQGLIHLLLIVLFAIITWRMGTLALNLKEAQEVSMTLKMPVWPVVAGLTTGLALFVLTLGARAPALFEAFKNVS